jgi:Concanavalin A-like lectin/glucanases superfamily/SdrD B-like domain
MRLRHQRRQQQRFRALVEMLEQRCLLASIVVNLTSDMPMPPVPMVTLRKAIAIADAATTPTTITFSPTVFSSHKTITLASFDPLELSNTKESITIIGPAVGVTVMSTLHDFNSGIFNVDSKVQATISNLSITGIPAAESYGIVNGGHLTFKNGTISGNSSGGVYNTGTADFTNVVVSRNTVQSVGSGGFLNMGTASLTDVTLSGNVANLDGEGEVTFGGGGMDNYGTATLTDVTISGNTADGAVGGGFENEGKATLTDVTITRNEENNAAGGGFANDGTATLTNVTISGNTDDGVGGGGISNSGTIKLANTIVAANSTQGSGPDVSGHIKSLGHNLIGKTDGSSGWLSSDLTGTIAHPLNAKLSPLANNGGPTQTLLPQTGSPAINAGSNALIPSGITTDQRGLPRISGGTVDIGAVEVQLPVFFSGTVFNDTNKNGKKDNGEAGLGGWEIYADINHDNKLDTGDVTTFTNSAGVYSIGLTSAGAYMLHEIVPANWTQTFPTNNKGISITLNPTSTKTGLNFGNFTTIKYLKTVATTSGIVAWWTFDNASQANSILNGYTGSLVGGAKISAAGKGAPITGEQNNTALALNGVSAFVNTNLTTQQQFPTAATYNVWINLGSTPAASGHFYQILAKSQFANDLDLQVETDGSVHFYTDTGSSTSFKPSSLTGWHMVTAEFDTTSKTRKIFWDGKQVASSTPGAHSPSTQTFTIGASAVFAGRFFDGSIDEATLWNRALTATEVTAIYNSSKG